MTRMFLRKFELKLNGNRGQELKTSVKLAPLHAILKISAKIQCFFKQLRVSLCSLFSTNQSLGANPFFVFKILSYVTNLSSMHIKNRFKVEDQWLNSKT